ncbi:MAG: SMC-Scp complex subunit ScpB [Gemmataceae bacterium]|nr:SMC-Scp complex subunit ScpB [Gemmataceae bacterium]
MNATTITQVDNVEAANRGQATSPGSLHTRLVTSQDGRYFIGEHKRRQHCSQRGTSAVSLPLGHPPAASAWIKGCPHPSWQRLPRNARPTLSERLGCCAAAESVPQDPLGRDTALATLEAVLLVADEPLPARRLAQAAGLADAAAARRLLKKLQNFYDQDGTAFQIEEIAGGFQLLTRPEYHRWLSSLRRGSHDLRLSAPARETLAIVAYRQPIMRADIEAIRGVNCADTLRLLMEKGLIKIVGRDDSLGRPVLYGTTKKFLQVFGLKSLKDLPRKGKPAGETTAE